MKETNPVFTGSKIPLFYFLLYYISLANTISVILPVIFITNEGGRFSLDLCRWWVAADGCPLGIGL